MALKSTIFRAPSTCPTWTMIAAEHADPGAAPVKTDERDDGPDPAASLHGDERLQFGRGISMTDEPALWLKDDSGRILRWIEVGLPDERLLRRACGKADEVIVLAYVTVGPWMCGGRRMQTASLRLPNSASSPAQERFPSPLRAGRTEHGTQLHAI